MNDDERAGRVERLTIECPVSDLDLWDDAVRADPFPAYSQLRGLGPVVWLERHGLFALPRFATVRSALTNWQGFSSAWGVGVDDRANSVMPPNIIKSDPPAHDGFRRELAAQLSVASLAPDARDVERTADAFVRDILRRRTFDAVADLARAFSLAIVCDLIGIPDDARDRLPSLAERAFDIFGPANARLAAAPMALDELFGHAFALAQSGRLCPGRRAAQLADKGLADEIVAYTWPGIDTTVHAIASAVYLFARHPDQWNLVRDDPSLIPSAFAEVLRMHAPVHYFTRTTSGPVDAGRHVLPTGAKVLVMYASANRDERHYPDPDRFDVTRNPTDQLSFGRGIHRCVGINLARLEAHALLAALALRVGRFELAGEPAWTINNTLHGPAHLPITAIARA